MYGPVLERRTHFIAFNFSSVSIIDVNQLLTCRNTFVIFFFDRFYQVCPAEVYVILTSISLIDDVQLRGLVSELNNLWKLHESISKLITVTKDLENRTKMLIKEILQLHGVLFTRGELISNDIQREFVTICREKPTCLGVSCKLNIWSFLSS
jgi:hypothetical protein